MSESQQSSELARAAERAREAAAGMLEAQMLAEVEAGTARRMELGGEKSGIAAEGESGGEEAPGLRRMRSLERIAAADASVRQAWNALAACQRMAFYLRSQLADIGDMEPDLAELAAMLSGRMAAEKAAELDPIAFLDGRGPDTDSPVRRLLEDFREVALQERQQQICRGRNAETFRRLFGSAGVARPQAAEKAFGGDPWLPGRPDRMVLVEGPPDAVAGALDLFVAAHSSQAGSVVIRPGRPKDRLGDQGPPVLWDDAASAWPRLRSVLDRVATAKPTLLVIDSLEILNVSEELPPEWRTARAVERVYRWSSTQACVVVAGHAGGLPAVFPSLKAALSADGRVVLTVPEKEAA